MRLSIGYGEICVAKGRGACIIAGMNRKALVAAGGVVVLIMIVAWVGWIARILFW